MYIYTIHTYNGILVSHEKNEILPFAATQMDLEIVILSEVSQTQKDKYHMIIAYMWNLRNLQMNLFTKLKQTHRYRKQTYGYQRGKGRGGIN